MMPQERRLSTRKTPKHFAYLSLPMNNGGIVVDVSEGGLGFRAIAPVEADGPIHLRFAIDSDTRISAVGELAWKDETGKIGGLRFTEISDEGREQIRVWAGRPNAVANQTAQDVQVVESAVEAGLAIHNRVDQLPDEADSPSLPYNLRPAIYSAPSNSVSMFPVELNSEAATAAVLPQFIQLFDEIREQVHDWANQAEAGNYDNPFADPAFDVEFAPRSKTELAPVSGVAIAEPPLEYVDATSSKADLAPPMESVVVQPGVEPEAAPEGHAEFERIVAAGNPLLYNLRPPVYTARFNPLSIFPSGFDSQTAAAEVAASQSSAEPAPFIAPASMIKNHPIAAIGATIILAFVVSMGIIVYASTSPAGQALLDWGEEMWRGHTSQPAPQHAPPSDSRAQDPSNTPRQ